MDSQVALIHNLMQYPLEVVCMVQLEVFLRDLRLAQGDSVPDVEVLVVLLEATYLTNRGYSRVMSWEQALFLITQQLSLLLVDHCLNKGWWLRCNMMVSFLLKISIDWHLLIASVKYLGLRELVPHDFLREKLHWKFTAMHNEGDDSVLCEWEAHATPALLTCWVCVQAGFIGCIFLEWTSSVCDTVPGQCSIPVSVIWSVPLHWFR